MQAFGQHAADDDSEREEVLEGLNFFDEQDEDDVDDEPGHRVSSPSRTSILSRTKTRTDVLAHPGRSPLWLPMP